VELTRILPAVASIYPCAQQQKLVKLVLPVDNLMYSSVNLDGGYMKRSFVCSQWFLLSSETTASRVIVNHLNSRHFTCLSQKIDDKTGNQWESAEFASVEKKEKFLRLMGAFKPSTEQRETSNYSAMAMNKEQEKAFASSLEKQYFQAMQSGKGKGVGLGYE
jgi:hypothetical protein